MIAEFSGNTRRVLGRDARRPALHPRRVHRRPSMEHARLTGGVQNAVWSVFEVGWANSVRYGIPTLLCYWLVIRKLTYCLLPRPHTKSHINDRAIQRQRPNRRPLNSKALFHHYLLSSTTSLNLISQGHSLGASYATLCYAELLRLKQNPSASPRLDNLRIRDLYTYGSPRVALEDFVDALSSALDPDHEYPTTRTPTPPSKALDSKSSTQLCQSSSFRILTQSDPVPLVPPVLLTDPNFIHLDSAYRVAVNEEPQGVESERGTHPRPPMLPVFDMSSHSE